MKFNNLEIIILTFIRLKLWIYRFKIYRYSSHASVYDDFAREKRKELEESLFCILTTYPGPHSDLLLLFKQL